MDMAEFCMPSLGADMEAGILVEWRVKPGDQVKRGDIIAHVETDKGLIEIEVFEEGIVEQFLIQPDTEVPVGAPLALIRTNGAEEGRRKPEDVSPLTPPATAPATVTPSPPSTGRRARVSPLARKLATDLGVDLNIVQGSGPHGAINKADVEQAAAVLKAKAPEQIAIPAPEPAVPAPKPRPSTDFQTGMRRAIAAAMSRANQEIPHYYLETRIDMCRALRWLETENSKRSIKDRILPAVLLVKAVAKALTDVPELNGYWQNDRLQVQEAINIGFAIALRQGGLVTPALHHADLKGWDELMADVRDLITRTRAGRLRSSDMTDSTITLTNLGDLGVEKVFGVIYPPQVAIVGFGKTTEQPWVENGMLGIRPVLTATLAGDHRATDGRTGAQFLDALNNYLQEVDKL